LTNTVSWRTPSSVLRRPTLVAPSFPHDEDRHRPGAFLRTPTGGRRRTANKTDDPDSTAPHTANRDDVKINDTFHPLPPCPAEIGNIPPPAAPLTRGSHAMEYRKSSPHRPQRSRRSAWAHDVRPIWATPSQESIRTNPPALRTPGSTSSTPPTTTPRANRGDRRQVLSRAGATRWSWRPKVWGEMGPGPPARAVAEGDRGQADASLKRLGTDVIDLYQIHRPIPACRSRKTLSP